MNRRSILAIALLPLLPGLAMAAPAAQDQADLARIERYLLGLRTLRARFLQIAPNGDTSQGNAWIERPGRLRFDYDPPAPFLLIAGYGGVMFHDRKLQQTSNFPLSQTPLGILLSEQPKLSGDVTVEAIDRQPGLIQVTLHRTGHQGDGSLTLTFADSPLELRQWSVIDPQRLETRVSLFDIHLGEKFNPKLFDITDPKIQPGGTPGR